MVCVFSEVAPRWEGDDVAAWSGSGLSVYHSLVGAVDKCLLLGNFSYEFSSKIANKKKEILVNC
jgi:hypothetical protein